MSHFAQAFWSADYAGGLGVLFGKLQQGVQENQQILTVARMRADAEELYAQHLADIMPATDRIADGFQRDDGASIKKAYEGVRTGMDDTARKHYKIASNIRELVVIPFGRWCEQHAARVQHSQDDLQNRVKSLDKQGDWVKKLRSTYFNKCRLVEDLEEEDKLAFKSPDGSSPKQLTPTVKIQEPDEDDEPVEIGDAVYQPDQMKKILSHMLDTIRLGETKVPILGTYQNVSSGSDIVEYIQRHMNANTIGYAERIGQDMIAAGYLRLVGNVGSVFANSSRMSYQWRPKVFQITGYPERRPPGSLARSSTILSDNADSPIVGAVNEMLSQWNPLNNAHTNESPSQKLRREARESDERYKAGVRKQDTLRCTLEEAMIEHFKFMERCELDRLKAIKAVILDFSGAISNVIPTLQSTVDTMMLFQETVQPLGDLRYLLENYRTGAFIPKAPIYENYYNSIDDQTFGVDIEARARADRKRVPAIIASLLTHLDQHYPLLDGDEARRAIWLVDVPLAASHRLRAEINNGKPPSSAILENYEVPIVASVLKLYLLELPDSLVSSNLYELIKAVYTNTAASGNDGEVANTRVSVLQNTLSQLRLTNIATLDALTTHFVRLIDLTSASEEYAQALTMSLAHCILRPRTETALSLEEKYAYRFLRDLFQFKDQIFNELKRSATISSARIAANSPAGTSLDGRPRTFSTDESNRKANMEERARAIASRSRASSPATRDRDMAHQQQRSLEYASRHRRESSKGPADTRFPVHATASPRATTAFPTLSTASPSTPSTLSRSKLDIYGADATNDRGGLDMSEFSHVLNVNAPSLNGGGAGLQALSTGLTPSFTAHTTETPTTATPMSAVNPVGHLPQHGEYAHSPSSSVEKRDSFSRPVAVSSSSAARFGRKNGSVTTAALANGKSQEPVQESREKALERGERRGVTLTDAPMDD